MIRRKWLISRVFAGRNCTKGLTSEAGSPTLPLTRSGRRADGCEDFPPVVHGDFETAQACNQKLNLITKI
jgi:hypothetical protein